ncbi:MAG TPA: MAC/perforin domain-containing protein [Phenylobacterium sp.]|jgi:hypothetical protein|nr:MAC/perforin domain-containing protein [Phenylobacterium sp.]
MSEGPVVIPGASALGFGFNVLGPMDERSLTQAIFSPFNVGSGTYTDPDTSVVYAVPDGMAVSPLAKGGQTVQIFETEADFESWFNQEVDVNISGWSAELNFQFAYAQALSEQTVSKYCLLNDDYSKWALTLESQAQSLLDPGFLAVVKALPATYGSDTDAAFFSFFDTYGTHVVRQVRVGGQFRYYLAVNTAAYSNETTISLNINLEYNAAFVDASAQSQTDWNTLGSNWTNNRSVTVSAIGGDASVLNAVDPELGTCDASVFQDWTEALEINPAVILYGTQEIHRLFGGATAANLKAAMDDYLTARITVQVQATSGFTVTVLNAGVAHPPLHPVTQDPAAAYARVALIDPPTGKVLFDEAYQASIAGYWPVVWTDVSNQITGLTDYIAVVAAAGVDLSTAPTGAMLSWMQSCGMAVAAWTNAYAPPGSQTVSPTYYGGVGRTGLTSGAASEAFATQPAMSILSPPWPSPQAPASIQSDWFINAAPDVWSNNPVDSSARSA